MTDASGRLYTYGRFASGRATGGDLTQPVAMAWYLESIEDTSGNLIEFAYDQRVMSKGTAPYPRSISYGHDRNVVLRFQPSTVSTRATSFYRAGYELPRAERPVGRIDVEIDRETVGSYHFTYETRGATLLLSSVSECWDGCLNPTTFDYGEQDGLQRLDMTSDSVGRIDTSIDDWNGTDPDPDAFNQWEGLVADFNMDGFDDLLHSDGYSTTGRNQDIRRRYALKLARHESVARQGDGPSYFRDAPLGDLANANCVGATLIHYDDDSFPDLLAFCGGYIDYTGIGEVRIFQNDGTGSFALVNTLQIGSSHHVVDLDHDGRQDIVDEGFNSNAAIAWRRNLGGALAGPIEIEYPIPSNLIKRTLVIDHDGDGIPSYVLFGTTQAFVLDADTSGEPAWESLPDIVDLDSTAHRVADLNGDGLSDLVVLTRKKHLSFYLNTGKGFKYFNGIHANPKEAGFPLEGHHFENSFVMDVNYDGFDDLLIPYRRGDEQGYLLVEPYPGTRIAPAPLPFRWGRRGGEDRYGYQMPRVGDFNGDGRSDVIFRQYGLRDRGPHNQYNPVLEMWSAGSASANLLTQATDGLGKRTQFVYGSSSVTQPFPSCVFPRRCLSRPSTRVVNAFVEDGASGPFRDPTAPAASYQTRIAREYQYRNASLDLLNGTYLGFERMVERHVSSAGEAAGQPVTETITNFALSEYSAFQALFYGAGRPAIVRRNRYLNADLSLVSWQQDQYDYTLKGTDGGGLAVEASVMATEWGEFDGTSSHVLGSRVITSDLDIVGRLHSQSTAWSDGRLDAVTTEYYDDGDPRWSQWRARGLLSLPRTIMHSSRTPISEGQFTQEYVLRFDYNIRGLVELAQVDFGDEEAYETRTTSTYDEYGNQLTRTTAARMADTLTVTDSYDAETHTFLSTRTNNLHAQFGVDDYGFDRRNGKMTWLRRIDGSWQTASYDGSGRIVRATDSSGRVTTTQYLPGAVAGSLLRVQTSGDGRPTESVDYNAFAQPVLESSTHWAPASGGEVTTVREYGYDPHGRIAARGLPHLDGTASAGYQRITYDHAGRQEAVSDPWQQPDGTVAEHVTSQRWIARDIGEEGSAPYWSDYQWAVRAHVAGEGEESSTTLFDLRGDVIGRVDGSGTMSVVHRGAFGRRMGSGYMFMSSDSFVLDPLGRPIASHSVQDGSRTFAIDGLGRRIGATDEMGGATSMDYDALGRLISRTDGDGTATFTYDQLVPTTIDPSSVGKLVRQHTASARLGTHATEYEYHGPGAALSTVTKDIDGEHYTTVTEYDALGRPEFVHYPQPAGAQRDFVVQYAYDPRGSISEISQAAVLPGEQPVSLWQALEVDAFGRYQRASAQGLTIVRQSDVTGKLRQQLVGVLEIVADEERYEYEEHGYLAAKLHPRETGTDEEFVYDGLGRVTSHSVGGVVGEFGYDVIGNLTLKPGLGTLHYPDITLKTRLATTDSGRGFQYDLMGRQIVRTGPGGTSDRQEFDYTDFDLPAEVRIGPDGSPSTVIRYHYDADEQKVSEQVVGGERTTYVGDLLKWTRDGAGNDERIASVVAPDGTVFEALLTTSTAAPAYRLHISDYQGSPRVVVSGGTLVKQAFDGWGSANPSLSTSVGYTGHEHDSPIGLTNMKGRIYDQTLGRFISPDPIMPMDGFSQELNRYAYVMNSPQNLVDPSGFQAEPPPSGPPMIVTAPAPPPAPPASDFYAPTISPSTAPNVPPPAPAVVPAAAAAQSTGFSPPLEDAERAAAVGEALDELGQYIAYIIDMLGGDGTPGLPTWSVAIRGTGKTVVKGTARQAVSIPGRVLSRINLSKEGIAHTLSNHLNAAKVGKSQFTIPESEIRAILQAKNTVQTPVVALESGNFARTVTSPTVVGSIPDKFGGGTTSVFTVITDKFGNLLTAFPGSLP